MAYRQFYDAAGMRWEVWEAHPTLTERRRLKDRRTVLRPSPERRTVALPRVTLAGARSSAGASCPCPLAGTSSTTEGSRGC